MNGLDSRFQEAPGAATAEPCLPARLRKKRLRRDEASEYLLVVHGLTVAVATLNKKASVGGGPSFCKFGRSPLYEPAELDRWAEEKLGPAIRSTSELRGQAHG